MKTASQERREAAIKAAQRRHETARTQSQLDNGRSEMDIEWRR